MLHGIPLTQYYADGPDVEPIVTEQIELCGEWLDEEERGEFESDLRFALEFDDDAYVDSVIDKYQSIAADRHLAAMQAAS